MNRMELIFGIILILSSVGLIIYSSLGLISSKSLDTSTSGFWFATVFAGLVGLAMIATNVFGKKVN